MRLIRAVATYHKGFHEVFELVIYVTVFYTERLPALFGFVVV